jgi:aspartyl-tRNA(Asn)/glutamyl-tRNA(Gln) amidotransferase subunit A
VQRSRAPITRSSAAIVFSSSNTKRHSLLPKPPMRHARPVARLVPYTVPLAHKDMFARAGKVVRYGSRVRTDHAPAARAVVLERLAQAGALDIGALAMAEFALGATGHNAAFGDCRNAHDPAFIAGGSSSGSGAAVALGAVYASIGSDTGGSVRIPAAANGCVGLKPTYGLLPRTGSMPLTPSIDVLGPIARSVRDLAIVLRIVAGHDADDRQSSRRPPPDYLAATTRGVRGLRIGIPSTEFLSPTVEWSAMRCCVRGECSRTPAPVCSEIELPPVAPLAELSRAIVYSEATGLHAPWLREHAERYTPQVRVRASTGLAIPAPIYFEALQLRAPLLQQFVTSVFARCDVLLTPLLPIELPRRDETDVGGGARMWELLAKLVRCTAPFNFLGLPALAVPVGQDGNGLPIAAQLVGRPFAEDRLLQAAAVQEAAWPARVPVAL